MAALRGHEVTLLEKSNKLGGLMPLAGVIKGLEMENLPDMVRYLATQLKKLGVKVELGREADVAAVLELKPQTVIVATGGELTTPQLKGIDQPQVLTSPALHRRIKPYLKLFGERFMGWATKFFLPVGKNVAVYGTGLHGMEVAEFLIKRGRKVALLDVAEEPGEGMLDFRLGLVMDWFGRKGIRLYNGVKDLEITSTGVSFRDKEGNYQVLAADTVITTAPLKSNRGLYDALQGRVAELYAIGDCKDPRMIVDAIREGWETARTL